MGSRSSTAQSVPPWALPYAQQLLRAGTDYVAPGATDPVTGKPLGTSNFPLQQMDPALQTQVAPFNSTQQAGIDYLTGSAGASAGLAGAGAQQVTDTLGGKYLSPDSNPYLNDTYNAAARGVTDQYKLATAPGLMAQAQQAGVSGGSAEGEMRQANQFSLGQNLSDLATQIYGGNYQAERGRQAQAGGEVPALQGAIAAPGQQLLGAGTLGQSQTQAELDAAQGNAQLKQAFPGTLLSYFGNLLGSATGGGGQTVAGTSK
jgi:hypothetical protein